MVLVASLSAESFPSLAQPGTLDTNFVFAGVRGVTALAVQSDGRIVYASEWQSTRTVSRIHANGAPDPSFFSGSGANDRIKSLAIQADGKVLAAGWFTNFSGSPRGRLVRLESNGPIDSSFNASVDGEVSGTALQGDGKLIVVGHFSKVNGVQRPGIARLRQDGSWDDSFNPTLPAECWFDAVALQRDGKTVAAGSLRSGGWYDPYLARFQTNGEIDFARPIWSTGPDSFRSALAVGVQRDGHIVVGGYFTNFFGAPLWNIARLNANATLDPTFNPGRAADDWVLSMLVQGDDKIYIGGLFSNYAGVARARLARLNADGSLDNSYQPASGLSMDPSALALQSDGRLLVPGSFGAAFNGLLRLSGDPLGAPVIQTQPAAQTVNAGDDVSFQVAVSSFQPVSYQWLQNGEAIAGKTNSSLPLPDVLPADAGDYLVVASNDFGAVTSAVATLTVITSPPVFVLQPESQVVPAGEYAAFSVIATGIPQPSLQWQFNGTNIPWAVYDRFYRYPTEPVHAGAYTVVASNVAGMVTSDPAVLTVTVFPPSLTTSPTNLTVTEGRMATFTAAASGAPPAAFQWLLEGQPVAGATNPAFTIVNARPFNASAYSVVAFNSEGAVTSAVARLTIAPAPTNPGAVDLSFGVNAGDAIYSLAVEPDGGVLVAGAFSSIGGVPRNRIARLFPDGRVDPAFDPGTGRSRYVTAMALAPSRKILLAGQFPPGFGGQTKQLIQLNADGTDDTNFVADTSLDFGNGFVTSVGVQRTGCIIVATSGQIVARLFPDGTLYNVYYPETPGGTRPPSIPPGWRSVLVLSDDKILTDYASRVAYRWNPNLTFDLTFKAPFYGTIAFGGAAAFSELSDGRILVGGSFYASTNGPAGGLLRLLRDGSIDASFNPARASFGRVNSIAVQNDGKILIGGSFTNISDVARRGIARLDPDGGLDPEFDPGAGLGSGAVNALALLPDCRLILAGAFTSVDNVAATNLALLFNDQPGPPAITVQPTNQIIAAGLDAFFQVGTPCLSLTFQWRRNGVDLPGATNTLLRLRHISEATDAGSYTVVVSNGGGSVTSEPAVLTVLPSPMTPGLPDVDFDPKGGVDGAVSAVVRRSDGRLLIGGRFHSVGGVARGGMARLHPDGSVDKAFDPGAGVSGSVLDMIEQPDGRILISGFFNAVNGVACTNLARLNSDGSVDSTFNAGSGPGSTSASLEAIALQPDGRILVYGSFSTFGGVARNRLARLNADGSVDLAFNPPASANTPTQPRSLALQSDGGILLGGVGGVARLGTNGVWDSGFHGIANGWTVNTMLVQADGRLVIGGIFQSSNLTHGILRLKTNGTVDSAFRTLPLSSPWVRWLGRDECGRLLAVGRLQTTNGNQRLSIVRLSPDGDLDPTFVASVFDAEALGAVVAGDGVVMIGSFASVNGITCQGVARLHLGADLPEFAMTPVNQFSEAGRLAMFLVSFNHCRQPFLQWFHDGVPIPGATNLALIFPSSSPSLAGQYTVEASSSAGAVTSPPAMLRVRRSPLDPGTTDTGFYPGAGANGPVRALVVGRDGKVLIGGDFTVVQGVERHSVARLNGDGSLDATFDPGAGAAVNPNQGTPVVRALAALEDGKVVVCGSFEKFGGADRWNIARLERDGSLDSGFDARFAFRGHDLRTLLLQPDGRLIVAGSGAWRVSTTGAVDAGFRMGFDSGALVYSLANDAAGRVLVGGQFTALNDLPRKNVARVFSDGRLDPSFAAGLGPNFAVFSVSPAPDAKVVIGGLFTNFNGVDTKRIARLNDDGSLDLNFRLDPGADSQINALAVRPDGKIYAAGNFTNFNGVARTRVVRLLPNGAVDQTFNPGEGADAVILALALDPFGALHLGGLFTSFDSFPRRGVVRVHAESRLAQPALNDGRFSAQILTTDGWTYFLERTANLSMAPWVTITNLPGNGLIQTITGPLEPAEQSFYRLRSE
jgi:uncharacterized delta-60 repeat protein